VEHRIETTAPAAAPQPPAEAQQQSSWVRRMAAVAIVVWPLRTAAIDPAQRRNDIHPLPIVMSDNRR
jgi:hypothetical protein